LPPRRRQEPSASTVVPAWEARRFFVEGRKRGLQMTRDLLTVVIPLHNGSTFIEATLDSLANQSRQDFQVIVVDDGSVDDGALKAASHKSDGPASPKLSLADKAGLPSPRVNVPLHCIRTQPSCRTVTLFPT
jgi:cellulose synthase/poly-beta-1,6-N-acetylglucosamine synthase-like glycosyltransferase